MVSKTSSQLSDLPCLKKVSAEAHTRKPKAQGSETALQMDFNSSSLDQSRILDIQQVGILHFQLFQEDVQHDKRPAALRHGAGNTLGSGGSVSATPRPMHGPSEHCNDEVVLMLSGSLPISPDGTDMHSY